MKRAGFGILAGIAVLVMLIGSWVGLRPYLNRETVKFAFLLDPTAPDDRAAEQGFLLALEEVDRKAGRFHVVHETADSTGSMGVTTSAGDCITALRRDEEVVAFVVARQLFERNLIASTLNAEQTLLVSAGCTDTALSRPGVRHYSDPAELRPSGTINYFGVFAPDDVIARRAGRWARRRGLRIARIILDYDRCGFEFSVYIAEILNRVGFEHGNPMIVDQPILKNPASRTWAVPENPDLLYCGLASLEDMGRLVKHFREKGFRGDVLCAGAPPGPEFLSTAGPHAEGAFLAAGIMPYEPGFEDRFRDRFGANPRPVAYGGYLAGRYLLEAIARADISDRAAIQDAFSRLGFFDKRGEPADPVVSLYVVKNGKFEFVEELKE